MTELSTGPGVGVRRSPDAAPPVSDGRVSVELGEPGAAGSGAGWAASTLRESIRRSLVVGAAVWSVVVVLALWADPDVERPWLFTVGQVLLSLLAMVTVRWHLPMWVLVALLATGSVATWWESVEMDGVLSFTTAWTHNLNSGLVAFMMAGRTTRVMPVVTAVLVPASLWMLHPDWLTGLVLASAVTAVAIQLGGRLGVLQLIRFADRVDRETAVSHRERHRAEVALIAGREAADRARVVHDTAVNTLGAVASGGAAVSDVGAVRRLCGRDARTLGALIADEKVEEILDFDALADLLGLDVSRRGLSGPLLVLLSRELSGDRRRALIGAVREAMRNVVKHAGTTEMELEAEVEEGVLQVRVADRGRGFDGRGSAGRGLVESVFARCEEVGISVELDTAVGRGTELRFRCPLGVDPDEGDGLSEPPGGESGGEDFGRTVRTMRLRAGWLFCAGVVGVGLFIEFVNRFGILSPTYGMHAVVAVAGLLAWTAGRAGRKLGRVETAVLVAAVPVAFVLGFAGTEFGARDLINWQCLGPAAPAVLLLGQARSRRALIVAAVLFASAVVGLTLSAGSPEIAAMVIVGAVPAVGAVAGWASFQDRIHRLGRRAAEEQEAAVQARLDEERHRVAASAALRWRHAGLTRSRQLLVSLADGVLDPTDESVRRACAEEERHLRQVTMMEPELVRSGHLFAAALDRARRRGVALMVRTGKFDFDREIDARGFVGFLASVVEEVPVGSVVTAGLFSTGAGIRFSVVAPSPVVSEQWGRFGVPSGWEASVSSFGDVQMLEAIRVTGF